MIDNVNLVSDESLKKFIFSPYNEGKQEFIKNSVFIQRLITLQPTWTSIMWIIDLLPNSPQYAIQAIEAYSLAHCQYLPDGRSTGLNDAIEIIKAKYMKHKLPVRQTLLEMKPREFELLVGYLYIKKGYQVVVTSKTHDGGYDIIAEKNSSREHERLHIECKRYSKTVGVQVIRNVLGTLNVKNATKAIVVCSSYFTQPAITEANLSNRIELLDIEYFDNEMRKYIDYNWVYAIPSYLKEMEKNMCQN